MGDDQQAIAGLWGGVAANAAPPKPYQPESSPAPRRTAALRRDLISALKTLTALELSGLPADSRTQKVLAGFPGWYPGGDSITQALDGAVPAKYLNAAARHREAYQVSPQLAGVIWAAARRAGFAGGRVLVVGCGTGILIGLAPDGITATGVDSDPTNTAIGERLYPQATWKTGQVGEVDLDPGSYDLVIGTVPNTHDRAAVLAAARAAKPGAPLILLAPHYVLDAVVPAMPQEAVAELGLQGAVRLPTRAQLDSGAPAQVLDLLIGRRPAPGDTRHGQAWTETVQRSWEGGPCTINAHFDRFPHRMGRARLGPDGHLFVSGDLDGDELGRLTATVYEIGDEATAPPPDTNGAERLIEQLRSRDGVLSAHPDGSITRRVAGEDTKASLVRDGMGEVRSLIGLRHSVIRQLCAEAAGSPTEVLDGLRADLNDRYEVYQAAYKPITRYELRERWGRDADAPPERLVPRNLDLLREDPTWPLLELLESGYDPDTRTVRRGALLDRPLLAPAADGTPTPSGDAGRAVAVLGLAAAEYPAPDTAELEVAPSVRIDDTARTEHDATMALGSHGTQTARDFNDESVRSAGRTALEDVAADPVREPSGPGGVLHPAGSGGGGGNSGAGAEPGHRGPAGRDVPAEARAAQQRPGDGGVDGGAGSGAAGSGAGRRSGRGTSAGDAQRMDSAGGGSEPSVLAADPRGRGGRPAVGSPSGEPSQHPASAPPEPGPPRFQPAGQSDLAPSGPVARVRANVAAVQTLRAIQAEDRPATPQEQQILARWSGWGAVPAVFDKNLVDFTKFAEARDTVRGLLSAEEYDAAKENVLNAHYTDAALVQAVWDALERLGFRGGDVLEPGCGSGNFLAFALAGSQLTGVELDPTTAGIARLLYPDARVLNESFADTRSPAGSYDMVVGNVPFGRFSLNDPRHNPHGHPIHDHFIIKSLHLTRPGGLVAVLTSRYTMDKQSPAARREMAALGDLVTAVRLPGGAHRRAAGTDVVTDLLIFRRREPGREPRPVDWERTESVKVGDEQAEVRVNSYFLHHPEKVLGTISAARGEFSDHDLTVVGDRDAAPALTTALGDACAHAALAGLRMGDPPAERPTVNPVALVNGRTDQREGYLHDMGDGTFRKVEDGRLVPHEVNGKAQSRELAGLLGLRDTVVALLEAEAATLDDTPQIDALRAELGARYQRYVDQFGPINRFKLGRKNLSPWQAFTAWCGREGHSPYPAGREAMAGYLQHLVDAGCGATRVSAQARAIRRKHTPTASAPSTKPLLPGASQAAIQITAQVRTMRGLDDDKGLDLIDAGLQRWGPNKPAQGGFRTDPLSAAVYALEHFDAVTQTATRAGIFTTRQVAPRTRPLGADNAEDALAICIDTWAEVRLDEIARLLGVGEHDARQALGTLVFEDPARDGRLVPAAEYLSGNVRIKLDAAVEAAARDERYAPNVDALTSVIPADIGPAEIKAQLGAAWIDADDVQQFLRETLEDESLQVEHPGGATWAVTGDEYSVSATNVWGTERMPAPKLAKKLLTQKPVMVYDTTIVDGNERRVINPDQTIVAQEKAAELAERFTEWLWEDPARSRRLIRQYNDLFNARVARSYDGAKMALPGMAHTFTPYPHQVAAASRMVNEPGVLLAHEVGAGKTREAAMGVMELKRLGLVRKAAVVVPNHMLEQFTREWMQTYPTARILAAGKEDLSAANRGRFVARCATDDWDAVIMTRSAFEKLKLSKPARDAYMAQETSRLEAKIDRAQAASRGRRPSQTLKRLQEALKRLKERIKKAAESFKDGGLTFEATGIDYLVVDEAHDYKNLATTSNIPDANIQGADRARDLDMKLHYLRSRNGPRVVTLMTATPIANSITEAYVMLRYTRPDLLEAAGLMEFDVFAATFGQVVTGVEMAPEGGSFRIKSRFARFHNVPELMQLWSLVADVKTGEDLQLKVPALAQRPGDGERVPEVVVVPRSTEQAAYVKDLGERAERVRSRQVDKFADNMLKISSDGRAAALDMRLVGVQPTQPGKIDVAADRIYAIWHEHKDDVYPDRHTGEESPVRGSMQLVFSDLGTPKVGQWNVYDELRDQLAARGMPRELIRFVHEAGDDDHKKAQLFAECNNGQVGVLIGSTGKMGVGTNVQRRAVALHHLDAPWRPADVQQREGRILRPGNLNPNIQILRYVVEGTFDGYMWQTLARKAAFIGQLMRGKVGAREMEDLSDATLSFEEVKALAAGDPRLLEKAKLDREYTRLSKLERSHFRQQDNLDYTIQDGTENIERLQKFVADLDTAMARRQPTKGKAFRMQVGSAAFTKRKGAGGALIAVLQAAVDSAPVRGKRDLGVIAAMGGFDLHASVTAAYGTPSVELWFDGLPKDHLAWAPKNSDRPPLKLRSFSPRQVEAADQVGVIQSLENTLADLEVPRAQAIHQIPKEEAEVEKARAQLGKPFPHAESLTEVRAQLDAVNNEIASEAAAENTSDDEAEDVDTSGVNLERAQEQAALPRRSTSGSINTRPAADNAPEPANRAAAPSGGSGRTPAGRQPATSSSGNTPPDAASAAQPSTGNGAAPPAVALGWAEDVLSEIHGPERELLTARLVEFADVHRDKARNNEFDNYELAVTGLLHNLLIDACHDPAVGDALLRRFYTDSSTAFRERFTETVIRSLYDQEHPDQIPATTQVTGPGSPDATPDEVEPATGHRDQAGTGTPEHTRTDAPADPHDPASPSLGTPDTAKAPASPAVTSSDSDQRPPSRADIQAGDQAETDRPDPSADTSSFSPAVPTAAAEAATPAPGTLTDAAPLPYDMAGLRESLDVIAELQRRLAASVGFQRMQEETPSGKDRGDKFRQAFSHFDQPVDVDRAAWMLGQASGTATACGAFAEVAHRLHRPQRGDLTDEDAGLLADLTNALSQHVERLTESLPLDPTMPTGLHDFYGQLAGAQRSLEGVPYTAAEAKVVIRDLLRLRRQGKFIDYASRNGVATSRYQSAWDKVANSIRRPARQEKAAASALAATREIERGLRRLALPSEDRQFLDELISRTERHRTRLAATPSGREEAERTDHSEDLPQAPTDCITILHNADQTLVYGTDKNNKEVNEALKAAQFRWSRNIGDTGAWFLPRPWKHATRSDRVRQLRQSLTRVRARFVEVEKPTDPAPATPTADAPVQPAPEVVWRQIFDELSTALTAPATISELAGVERVVETCARLYSHLGSGSRARSMVIDLLNASSLLREVEVEVTGKTPVREDPPAVTYPVLRDAPEPAQAGLKSTADRMLGQAAGWVERLDVPPGSRAHALARVAHDVFIYPYSDPHPARDPWLHRLTEARTELAAGTPGLDTTLIALATATRAHGALLRRSDDEPTRQLHKQIERIPKFLRLAETGQQSLFRLFQPSAPPVADGNVDEVRAAVHQVVADAARHLSRIGVDPQTSRAGQEMLRNARPVLAELAALAPHVDSPPPGTGFAAFPDVWGDAEGTDPEGQPDRAVIRTWVRDRYVVSTVHPQSGNLPRGQLMPVNGATELGPDAEVRWQISNYESEIVEDSFTGTYDDAERRLLDATAEVDELLTPEEHAEMVAAEIGDAQATTGDGQHVVAARAWVTLLGQAQARVPRVAVLGSLPAVAQSLATAAAALNLIGGADEAAAAVAGRAGGAAQLLAAAAFAHSGKKVPPPPGVASTPPLSWDCPEDVRADHTQAAYRVVAAAAGWLGRLPDPDHAVLGAHVAAAADLLPRQPGGPADSDQWLRRLEQAADRVDGTRSPGVGAGAAADLVVAALAVASRAASTLAASPGASDSAHALAVQLARVPVALSLTKVLPDQARLFHRLNTPVDPGAPHARDVDIAVRGVAAAAAKRLLELSSAGTIGAVLRQRLGAAKPLLQELTGLPASLPPAARAPEPVSLFDLPAGDAATTEPDTSPGDPSQSAEAAPAGASPSGQQAGTGESSRPAQEPAVPPAGGGHEDTPAGDSPAPPPDSGASSAHSGPVSGRPSGTAPDLPPDETQSPASAAPALSIADDQARPVDASAHDVDQVAADTTSVGSAASGTPAVTSGSPATDPTPPAAGSALNASSPSPKEGPKLDDTSNVPAPGSWAERLTLVKTGTRLEVRGTNGGPEEEELRSFLKQLRMVKPAGQPWQTRRFSPHDAEQQLRDWITETDRRERTDTSRQMAAGTRRFTPTAQQQAIIDAFGEGRTIVVQALAGTGKTSTLLLLADEAPGKRIGYIAFNGSIAAEAREKFPRHVTAGTAHSFARRTFKDTPLGAKIERQKVGKQKPFAPDWVAPLGILDEVQVGDCTVDAADIARAVIVAVREYRQSADQNFEPRHVQKPDFEVGDMRQWRDLILPLARKAWADLTSPTGTLQMTHDDYLKLWALGQPRLPFDVIFFDEAQDINPVLEDVIRRQPQQTVLVVVGDSNQSIYGFRGAKDSLANWQDAVVLPLTQSWRFGPAVAEAGNQFLRLLGSPLELAGNPALDSTLGPVERPDAILTRTNAGAVAAVFHQLDLGRRVALAGGAKEIEDLAKAASDLQKRRPTKHPELSRFKTWDEVVDFVDTDPDGRPLKPFVRLINDYGPDGLRDMARRVVSDKPGRDGRVAYDILVSTAHKSKGLEFDHVRIADDFPQPKEDQATRRVVLPAPEELRLAYVAVTRAKLRLERGSLSYVDHYTRGATGQVVAGAAERPAALALVVPEPVPEQGTTGTVASAPEWQEELDEALRLPDVDRKLDVYGRLPDNLPLVQQIVVRVDLRAIVEAPEGSGVTDVQRTDAARLLKRFTATAAPAVPVAAGADNDGPAAEPGTAPGSADAAAGPDEASPAVAQEPEPQAAPVLSPEPADSPTAAPEVRALTPEQTAELVQAHGSPKNIHDINRYSHLLDRGVPDQEIHTRIRDALAAKATRAAAWRQALTEIEERVDGKSEYQIGELFPSTPAVSWARLAEELDPASRYVVITEYGRFDAYRNHLRIDGPAGFVALEPDAQQRILNDLAGMSYPNSELDRIYDTLASTRPGARWEHVELLRDAPAGQRPSAYVELAAHSLKGKQRERLETMASNPRRGHRAMGDELLAEHLSQLAADPQTSGDSWRLGAADRFFLRALADKIRDHSPRPDADAPTSDEQPVEAPAPARHTEASTAQSTPAPSEEPAAPHGRGRGWQEEVHAAYTAVHGPGPLTAEQAVDILHLAAAGRRAVGDHNLMEPLSKTLAGHRPRPDAPEGVPHEADRTTLATLAVQAASTLLQLVDNVSVDPMLRARMARVVAQLARVAGEKPPPSDMVLNAERAMSPERWGELATRIRDETGRWADLNKTMGSGHPSRYIAEGSHCDRNEWEWVHWYINRHKDDELLRLTRLTQEQIEARNERVARWAHRAAPEVMEKANAGDLAGALDMVDMQAAVAPWADRSWHLTRDWLRERDHASSEPAAASTTAEPTEPEVPEAAEVSEGDQPETTEQPDAASELATGGPQHDAPGDPSAGSSTPDDIHTGNREPATEPATTEEPDPDAAPYAAVLAGDEIGPGLPSEFSDGEPFTSTKKIRGPLREVKTVGNALRRIPQWQAASGQHATEFKAAFEVFRDAKLDDIDPETLLALSVRLARAASAALKAQSLYANPVFNTLASVSRMTTDFTAQLVATAVKPNRWKRLFGKEPPAVGALPSQPARAAGAASGAPADTLPGLAEPSTQATSDTGAAAPAREGRSPEPQTIQAASPTDTSAPAPGAGTSAEPASESTAAEDPPADAGSDSRELNSERVTVEEPDLAVATSAGDAATEAGLADPSSATDGSSEAGNQPDGAAADSPAVGSADPVPAANAPAERWQRELLDALETDRSDRERSLLQIIAGGNSLQFIEVNMQSLVQSLTAEVQAEVRAEVLAELAALAGGTVEGTSAVQRSGARRLMERMSGAAEAYTKAQWSAIWAAQSTGDPKPGERVTAYAAVAPHWFRRLHPDHQTAIREDLAAMVAHPPTTRRGTPQWVGKARTLAVDFAQENLPGPGQTAGLHRLIARATDLPPIMRTEIEGGQELAERLGGVAGLVSEARSGQRFWVADDAAPGSFSEHVVAKVRKRSLVTRDDTTMRSLDVVVFDAVPDRVQDAREAAESSPAAPPPVEHAAGMGDSLAVGSSEHAGRGRSGAARGGTERAGPAEPARPSRPFRPT